LFVGQHEHSLDRKGRVVLPAPFRASVADRGYVTRLDQCIGLWSHDGFASVAERWKAELEAGNISLRAFRKFINSVSDVKLDAAGRVTLPRELLDELGFDSQVVVCGLYDRVEIWPIEKYEDDQDDEAGDELAAAITRLGL
jgi:MraZ protein